MLFLYLMHIYLFICWPLISDSGARKLCTMRQLGHLCPRDKSRINQTLSLIMCARLKGGKRGFRLDSPRVNLSLTCVIWRSVNTDYLADETRVCINFHPAHPQGECIFFFFFLFFQKPTFLLSPFPGR